MDQFGTPVPAAVAPMPIHGIVAVHLCTAASAADAGDAANADTGTVMAVQAITIHAALTGMLNLTSRPPEVLSLLQSGQDRPAG